MAMVFLLVRNRYPDCPSPLLDELWREKGFGGVREDMVALWEKARMEAKEGKKNVEENQREVGEVGDGGGERRSDAL